MRKPKSPNWLIWDARGLSKSGAEKADAAMPHLLKALEIAGEAISGRLIQEALFQMFELPRRTKEYQEANRWRKP